MRQLHPVSLDPVDPATVYGDIPEAGVRPWVRLMMIASVDGATAVGGLSGGLGGPADRRVYLLLRSLTDVILAAAGTVRSEGYGPAWLPPDLVDARRERGQTPMPPIAVVSRSCVLDWDSAFFTDATVRPMVITGGDAPAGNRERAAQVADVLLAGESGVDLARALAALASRGARSVLSEGGPSLNGQLADAGLVDEVCTTVSPRLVSGDSKRILTGPALESPTRLGLCSVCEDDGYLFLRYRSG